VPCIGIGPGVECSAMPGPAASERHRHPLVWFRSDLRVRDNPALHAACSAQGPVTACFLIAHRQWREHDWSP
jgi:hypothetical protein